MDEYDDYTVLFKSNSNQIWLIKKYIDNPFLPVNIVDELINFYVTYTQTITRETLGEGEEQAIILDSGILEDNKKPTNYSESDYFQGIATALLSFLSLKTCSKNLTQIIRKWFKLHGISEVNLRFDYKNTEH